MASVTFMNWASPNSIATHISMLYDQWQGYRTVNRDKWTEIESYLFATDTTSLEGGKAHDHTTHIPIVAEIKEELEAIMYSTILPHEDFLSWRPYTVEAAAKDVRYKVLAYLRNRHSLNDFEKTFRKLIQDLVIYGNCFVKVEYVNETENGVGYVGPKPKRISPYDIVFDPTRSSFTKTPKIIRSMMSLGEFIEWAEMYPESSAEVIQDVVSRRASFGTLQKTERNKANQYTPDGFTNIEAYYSSGLVEVLMFYGDVWDKEAGSYTKNRCVAVVDRVSMLFDVEEKQPHIYKASWSEKPDNLWSQGPLDKIVGLNYQINHRENSKSDALDRYIFPDKVFVGDVEEVYNEETGQTYYLAPEGGGVTDITPDTTVLTADMHQERLKAEARSAAGLPPQLMGFRTPGEKTAFEVQQLDDAALRKFLHKAAQFEMDLLEPVVRSELLLGAENYTSIIQAITSNDEGLPVVMSITKDDLMSNGKLVPVGARRFARQNQQMMMLNQMANSNIYGIIQNHINSYAVAKVVEELGGFDSFEFIEKYVGIRDQSEAQFEAALAEQELVAKLDQPGLNEM